MTQKLQSFEDFLRDKWPAEGVLDDDMPDAFDNWLSQLDGEEYIAYANEYGQYCIEFSRTSHE